jgi:hypothetical protein
MACASEITVVVAAGRPASGPGRGGAAMTATTELVPGYLDVTRVAVASFFARNREPTLTRPVVSAQTTMLDFLLLEV